MNYTCTPPGVVPFTDDATWAVTIDNDVVVWRLDGRRIYTPLQRGGCAACTAELLYAQSCEMRKN